MATKTLDILIRARDEASRTFQKVGVAGKTASAELSAAGTAGGKGFSQGVTKETSTLGSKLKSQFASLGPLIGGVALASFAKAAIGQAEAAQKVAAQTAAVLKSTGEAAGVSADHVVDLAGSLSKVAAVDDEVIQQGENVLLTFTNIRNEAGKGNDIFDQATTAALDLSSALGQDLQSSVIQIGKALNDPIKGVTALQRVGVSFTEQQKEQIKTLVESGKTLEAQKLILGELQKEFSGAAAANATSSEKMKVAFGNLEEAVGQALIPVLQTLATVLTPLIDAFTSLPQPLQTVISALGLTAVAIKVFGGSITGAISGVSRLVIRIIALATAQGAATVASEALAVAETEATVSTDALAVSQGAATASSGRLAVAEGAAAAGGTAAAASTGGFAASLAKLGPIAVIAGAAIWDVVGAVKIYNAQQDTNTANAEARAASYRTIALEIGNTAIQTGRLTRRQADQVELWVKLRQSGLATKGVLQQLKDVQGVLDARVKEGRISFGAYARIIRQTGLNMNVTAGQAGSLAGSLDAGAAAANRLARQLAKVPFGLGGFFQPFIPAAQGFHGSVSQPTLFMAGERGTERVDIGPTSGGGPGGGNLNVFVTHKPDRRRFVQADNYELRYGGA